MNKLILIDTAAKAVAYARVSNRSQKEDLDRQQQVLELYCTSQGWMCEVIADLGSGMNCHKNQKLIDGMRQAAKEAPCS